MMPIKLKIRIFIVLIAGCLAYGKVMAVSHVVDEIISGVVADKDGEPLAGAIVRAVDDRGRILAYVIAGRDGKFKLVVPAKAGKASRVKVSLMSYREKDISLSNREALKDIRLEENPRILDEIVARGPRVFQKGDTIVYNVDSIKSKTDLTIEDVLSKIPGITVSPHGQISYQNKPINKFYIEGMDLLGDQYTLGSRNISAADVSSISVYENHQPVKAMKDLQYSEEAAIDLKMKKSSFARPVGNVRVGMGGDDRQASWLGEVFALLVSKRLQALITAKGNNTGAGYRSELDFRQPSGGDNIAEAARGAGDASFGSPPVSADRYKRSKEAMTAINFLYKINDDRNIRFNFGWNYDRGTFTGDKLTSYDMPDNALPLEIHQDFISNNRHSRLSGTMVYTLNSRETFLSDMLRVKGDFTRNAYRLTLPQVVRQNNRADSYDLVNILEYTRRKGNRLWRLQSETVLANVPQNSLHARGSVAEGEWPFMPDTNIVSQRIHGLRFSNSESTGYSLALSPRLNVGVRAKVSVDYQTFYSTPMFGMDYTPLLTNALESLSAGIYLTPSIGYTSPRNSVSMSLSVPFSQEYIRYADRAGNNDRRTAPFVPGLTYDIRLDVIKGHKLSASFSWKSSLTGFSSYLTAPVFSDYRSVGAIGSGYDSRRKVMRGSLFWAYKRVVKGINTFATLSYTSSSTDRLRSLDVSESITGSYYSKSKSRSHTWMLNGNIVKQFFDYRSATGMNFSATAAVTSVGLQSKVFKVRNLMVMGAPYFTIPLIRNLMEGKTRATLIWSHQAVVGSGGGTGIFNYALTQQLAITPVKQLIFNVSASLNASQAPDGAYRHDLFVDAGARYMFSPRIDLMLKMTNLTDRRSYEYVSLGESVTVRNVWPLTPLGVMATVRFSY